MHDREVDICDLNLCFIASNIDSTVCVCVGGGGDTRPVFYGINLANTSL